MATLCRLLARSTAAPLHGGAPSLVVLQPPRRYKEMIEPMEHCTGIEKRERLAMQEGCDDPFGMTKVLKRGPGTKECPNLVPSAFEARMVGCICHPEQRFAQWMWVTKEEPKRCECGHWFKLVEVEAF